MASGASASQPQALVIAVDGPAASGKGTLARQLAEYFQLPHLDTGLLYRAVGMRLRIEGMNLDRMQIDGKSADDRDAAISIAQSFVPEWLHHPGLRSREAGSAATAIAVIPEVRKALREFQQAFARQPGGAVLDGRDIGTVIAPSATLKLWVTASAPVRAHRRYLELISRGQAVKERDILADLVARDLNDAPNMIKAVDAITIDTSHMNIQQAFGEARRYAEAKKSGKSV